MGMCYDKRSQRNRIESWALVILQFLIFNPVRCWISPLPSCQPKLVQNNIFQVDGCVHSRVHSTKSGLTEWVIENLEDESSSEDDGSQTMKTVTTFSNTKAGENDTLPSQGLAIGPFRIFASLDQNTPSTTSENMDTPRSPIPYIPIKLLQSRNGWGTGVHPTTRLCLQFLSHPHVIQQGNIFLDYGCGSGILTIAALLLGCRRAHGVDIEAEALISTERNVELNSMMYSDPIIYDKMKEDFDENIELSTNARRFIGWHAREIIPYGLKNDEGHGADICVANILIGQLVRPSMVSTIVSNLSPGAWLCLSGIRPEEVNALKAAYNDYVDWDDDLYAELAARDTECSIESYGFDVGTWARVVGRLKTNLRSLDSRNFSEEAVS